MGNLPLAIRLAGRYLTQSGTNASEYLSWLKTTLLEALVSKETGEENVSLLVERSLEQLSETACQVVGVVGRPALVPFSREVIGAALDLSLGEQIKALGELVNYGILLHHEHLYEVSHNLIYWTLDSGQVKLRPSPTGGAYAD